jgi:hypothetical protein
MQVWLLLARLIPTNLATIIPVQPKVPGGSSSPALPLWLPETPNPALQIRKPQRTTNSVSIIYPKKQYIFLPPDVLVTPGLAERLKPFPVPVSIFFQGSTSSLRQHYFKRKTFPSSSGEILLALE